MPQTKLEQLYAELRRRAAVASWVIADERAERRAVEILQKAAAEIRAERWFAEAMRRLTRRSSPD